MALPEKVREILERVRARQTPQTGPAPEKAKPSGKRKKRRRKAKTVWGHCRGCGEPGEVFREDAERGGRFMTDTGKVEPLRCGFCGDRLIVGE